MQLKYHYYLLFQYRSSIPRLPEDEKAIAILGECWVTLLIPTNAPDAVDTGKIWDWIENQEGFVARGSFDCIDTEEIPISIDKRKIAWLAAIF